MSLDDFTTTAQALLAAAGHADTLLIASMTRRGAASEYYLHATEEKALPWPETVAGATQPTADAALAEFARQLGTAYPLPAIVYATAEQRQRLITLYNHFTVKRSEKTKMHLNLDRYTEAQAKQMLADGPNSFRQELRRREAASRGYAVSGSVQVVQAIEQAA